MGSDTLPSACYILSDESSILFYSTSNGYNEGRAEGNPSLNIYNRKIIEGRAEGHDSLKQQRRTTPAGSSMENRRHPMKPRKKRRHLVGVYCFLKIFFISTISQKI